MIIGPQVSQADLCHRNLANLNPVFLHCWREHPEDQKGTGMLLLRSSEDTDRCLPPHHLSMTFSQKTYKKHPSLSFFLYSHKSFLLSLLISSCFNFYSHFFSMCLWKNISHNSFNTSLLNISNSIIPPIVCFLLQHLQKYYNL